MSLLYSQFPFLWLLLIASQIRCQLSFRRLFRAHGQIPTRLASPARAAGEKQIPLGHLPSRTCASTSLRKCFNTDCTGAGTICPSPQIDVRLMAWHSSSIKLRSASYCFSETPPRVQRTSKSVIFCDPTRQGTHFPHDSLR